MIGKDTIPEPALQKRPSGLTRRHAGPLLAAGALGLVALVRFGEPLRSAFVGSDDISQQEVLARTAAFAAMRPLALPLVPPQSRGQAISSLGLKQDEQGKMVADVLSNRVRLAWLTLYDSDVEDGDAVTVNSAGFSRSLVLTKAPITIALPLPQNGVVELTGIIDGRGGGVTVGVVTPAGPIALPPMSVGQTLRIPVANP